jgi:hypothetical protein
MGEKKRAMPLHRQMQIALAVLSGGARAVAAALLRQGWCTCVRRRRMPCLCSRP